MKPAFRLKRFGLAPALLALAFLLYAPLANSRLQPATNAPELNVCQSENLTLKRPGEPVPPSAALCGDHLSLDAQEILSPATGTGKPSPAAPENRYPRWSSSTFG